jgi:hypothetical protein
MTPSKFAQALEAAVTREVTIAPYPFRFRIRRIDSEKVAEVGGAMLLAMRARDAGEPQPGPDERYRQRGLIDGVIAAGIVAVDYGEGWCGVGEGLRFVATVGERSPDDGRFLPSEDLPPKLAPKLCAEIMSISGDEEGAARAIATFLAGPQATADAPCGSA